jgi:hypothetical protein
VGERHRALEALKTLLVTRPILYLGFGLRDPDFLYLRDLLLNIFQGATRDHYAIMPDIGDDETDYWRRQYGIRLVGYHTHPRPVGSRDHRELLEMLVSLAARHASAPHAPAVITPEAVGEIRTSDAERVLALARYAAGLLRLAPEEEPIETHVSSVAQGWRGRRHVGEFEYWMTTRFLTKGPPRAILIGLPGSGKSFALRLATARLAQVVQQACLDDTIDTPNLALPLLIDLKLYQGDLYGQIEAALPPGFSLKDFLGKLRLRLFLDAFNEMPSSYFEDGSVFKALERLRNELGDFDYVITSRTVDGLPSEDLPQYELAWFDPDHVDRALAERGSVLTGHFQDDIRWLLSRPFFLHLVTSGAVSVPEGARLGDIYKSFLDNLQLGFTQRFSINLPLTAVLSHIAYRALDNEREAFPLGWVTDQLLMVGDLSPGSIQDIVNWLIARGALIPYSGARASFVHQSITEYCAALELVRLCDAGAFSLRDTVALKKWDQCLFLALGMMPERKAEEILDFLTRADLELAFSAVRYAEEGQSEAITKLLQILIERRRDFPESLARFFELPRLPFGKEHEPYLDQILNFGGMIGGAAIEALTTIRGPSFKCTLLELLDREKKNYIFGGYDIARALGPLLDESDLPRLLDIAMDAAFTQDDEISDSAVAALLAYFEPDKLIAAARSRVGSPLPPNLVGTLCKALSDRKDRRSFDILANFVLEGHDRAISGLYVRLPRDEAASHGSSG